MNRLSLESLPVGVRSKKLISVVCTTCRSVKETLECSLFEAQQHVSQLEIARSQLELQLHTVTQAKDVIQGDAPRALFLMSPLPRQDGIKAALCPQCL